MSFDPVLNFAYGTVLTAPSPATTGTSLVLNSGEGARFPQPSTDGPFNIVVWASGEKPLSSNAEIMRCTARSTDTLTVTRQQESTSARTVVVGDQVALTPTKKTSEDITNSLKTGWTPSTDTWTYVAANQFEISGKDVTSTFTKGTRLKFTQTTVKYGVVVGSSFSTNTTVTIAVNNDYTIANAAISANYYSYAANPQGYPDWFNFTTTWGGFSSPPNGAMKYSIIGHTCTIETQAGGGTGTSNATTMTFTVPVAPLLTLYLMGWARGYDNGSHLQYPCQLQAAAGNTTISAYKTNFQGAWTSSGEKVVTFNGISYEF